MTQMQIAWQNMLETVRSNRAREEENYRSNRAREDETYRHNSVWEAENARHNVAVEGFSQRSLEEQRRHNTVSESQEWRRISDNAVNAYRNYRLEQARLAETKRWNQYQQTWNAQMLGQQKAELAERVRSNDLNFTVRTNELAEKVRSNKRSETLRKRELKQVKFRNQVDAFYQDIKSQNETRSVKARTMDAWTNMFGMALKYSTALIPLL